LGWAKDDRERRRHDKSGRDQREPFERDRDRILYSSAFRRLAGITQVVRSGEADVFHTRLQHTLKVAQVGRRIAQICERTQPELCRVLGVGNAQSFRILTRLAVRYESPGLDLTRATLAACLKYPWLREPDTDGRNKKWGAYSPDSDDFQFARELLPGTARSAEAELMDWADDIAYSVHDIEDFHRCGAIPWHRIFPKDRNPRRHTSDGKPTELGDRAEVLVLRARDAWYDAPTDAEGRLRGAVRRLEEFISGGWSIVIDEPYEGTRDQREALRSLTSALISRYIQALKLRDVADRQDESPVTISDQHVDEVKILKQITREYIISNPALVAQQNGQKRIVQSLFVMLMNDSSKGPPQYLPTRLRYLWDDGISIARFAADCIASLTEAEAVGLHGRLHGLASGSVLDPIVR
jgi:dGTPase